MNNAGEHIALGFTGQILIVASFISLLAALVCYFGRHWFRIHLFTVISAMGLLWYMLIAHHMEYKYVWEHTSPDLSLGYLISSLWAGPEGSFLLWLFWQGFIGVLLMRRAGYFERPVMIVFIISQLFLNATILGINIAGMKIGSNPFILISSAYKDILGPVLNNTEYVSSVTAGNGLNPLLQNFWMTAHPPVLFLGFASLLVPFSYAIAALWKIRYTDWLRPVIPWMSFGILALGIGLLMGGAWAYEDLTFGGFWSWDPVENSSLVPWLAMVISLHLVIASIANKQSLFPAFILTFLSYVFVLYSSFLTRSGILGSTSAHAFGETGMTWHFAIYIIVFFLMSFILLFFNYNKFPKNENETFLSKEFWIFIGCFILILSTFQIIFSTSIPLINKIFDTGISVPLKREAYYNAWQIPFTIFILLSLSITQFLSYGKNFFAVFFRKMFLSLIISLVLTVLLFVFSGVNDFRILMLAWVAFLVIFSSLDMIVRFYRYSRNYPSLIGHLGLGLFIFGIIMAFSQSKTISKNILPVDIGNSFDVAENMLLPKDTLLPAGPYFLKYIGYESVKNETFYTIRFYKKNNDGSFTDKFYIKPSVVSINSRGNVYIPDTKHFFDKDIFTHILYTEIGKNALSTGSGNSTDKYSGRDIIIIRSIIFPYIKILWIGGIIMLTGFLFSIIKRRKFRTPIESDDEVS